MTRRMIVSVFAGVMLAAGVVYSHGDVTPQEVDVSDLPSVDGWGEDNPYAELDGEDRDAVIRRGHHAYRLNCANCHGIDARAGGIAPDLRLLTPSVDDAYYVGRVRDGGGRGMPAFGEVLQPEAVWAIRVWLETLYEDAMEEYYGAP